MRPNYIDRAIIVKVVECLFNSDVDGLAEAIGLLPRPYFCRTNSDILARALMDYECFRVSHLPFRKRRMDVETWRLLQVNLPCNSHIGWRIKRLVSQVCDGGLLIRYEVRLKYRGKVLLQMRSESGDDPGCVHVFRPRQRKMIHSVLGPIHSRHVWLPVPSEPKQVLLGTTWVPLSALLEALAKVEAHYRS